METETKNMFSNIPGEKTPVSGSRIFIVLPAFNEALSIGTLLEHLDEAMKDAFLNYQTIVVDDGSTDRTSDIVNK